MDSTRDSTHEVETFRDELRGMIREIVRAEVRSVIMEELLLAGDGGDTVTVKIPAVGTLSPMDEAILGAVGDGLDTAQLVADRLRTYSRKGIENRMSRLARQGILERPSRGVYAVAWGRA